MRLAPLLTALLLVTSLSARAEEATWGLRWKAPDACIDSASLARAVEARLGHHVFGLKPQYRIDGVLAAGSSPKWKATLTVTDSGGDVAGSRDVTSDDASCHAIDDNLAFVIAVMIDPKVRPAGEAPKAITEVAPKAAPPAAPRVTNADGVYLHVDADRTKVHLMRLAGVASGYASGTNVTIVSFSDECTAPCDEVIPRPRDTFHFEGESMPPSPAFTLEDHAPATTVTVHGGSVGMVLGGIMMATFGITGGLTGGILGGVGIGGLSRGSSGLFLAGAIMLGVGIVLTAVGIPLARAGATTLDFSDQPVGPQSPAMPQPLSASL
ncbi:MAG: hypothetical protein K1X89_05995 [Myxococcaceae bacterium]|nr:hypothetical protein [Myxococcaceae bacterium]